MKKIDKLYLYLPLILGLSFIFINIKFFWITLALPGIEFIIDSIINYTSIIIGVLIALFGVVVALSDKDVMIKLQKKNDDKTIFKYSVETLISNFILLIFSISMQSLVRFDPPLQYIDYIISIWVGIIIFALISSIRTIYFLLMISFNQNDNSKRPVAKYGSSEVVSEELRRNS